MLFFALDVSGVTLLGKFENIYIWKLFLPRKTLKTFSLINDFKMQSLDLG